ncbi:MAG: hypothetical protein IJO75_01275 [Clostridia bacterium]|nr:hypothetical protein [Clostridia bacterium]
MMKGHDEHAYWMKETMRLMPVMYEKGRELFDYETELRDLGLDERAERVREVKCAIYHMTMHCRLRNGDLIERTSLKRVSLRLVFLRYVRGYSWKKLFNTQGVSTEHCKRMHRDAIAKIAAMNRDTDYREIYEREKAQYDALLDQIGEK